MSLHYLLDGYNIIKGVPQLALKPLKEGRCGLIRWIETQRPQGSFKNTVTIIFDGQQDVFSPASASSVKMIFTRGETADEHIKRMVEEASHRRSLVVVTNDKAIKFHVRPLGARVMGVDEFMAKGNATLSDPDKTVSSQRAGETKAISKTVEYKITSEFKKIWLKDDTPKT